jgi:hypothetical protein
VSSRSDMFDEIMPLLDQVRVMYRFMDVVGDYRECIPVHAHFGATVSYARQVERNLKTQIRPLLRGKPKRLAAHPLRLRLSMWEVVSPIRRKLAHRAAPTSLAAGLRRR